MYDDPCGAGDDYSNLSWDVVMGSAVAAPGGGL
jgi:hypothetical protein